MSEQILNDLRACERHAIGFEVAVRGHSLTGESFSDAGRLKDLSDQGLCLITDHPEHYYEAQTLDVKIELPGTDTLEAFMLCEATVAWVRTVEDAGGEHVLIGVFLNSPMTFENHKRSAAASSEKRS